MNDLSNAALLEHHSSFTCKPLPSLALYILPILFFVGLSVSIFILVVVHRAVFLLSLLLLSALVLSCIAWNTVSGRHKAAVSFFIHSLPDSDLGAARDGDLVKVTGLVSCGDISLESSYERANSCVYTSTLLFEYGRLGLKPVNVNRLCSQWSLAYCERFSTDFYVTDEKTGLRAMVKAGSGCTVLPLIVESKIVTTSKHCRVLSNTLRKWLRERNLPMEVRQLRVEEGYIQEGSIVTVVGMFRRIDDVLMIVPPPQIISTRCLWRRLFLPVDVDGLVLGVPDSDGPLTNLPPSQQ